MYLTPCLEHSGSGVELRTLDYENPGSNPGCGVKTFGKFFQSTLLQFTQLYKWVPGYRQWWICIRAAFVQSFSRVSRPRMDPTLWWESVILFQRRLKPVLQLHLNQNMQCIRVPELDLGWPLVGHLQQKAHEEKPVGRREATEQDENPWHVTGDTVTLVTLWWHEVLGHSRHLLASQSVSLGPILWLVMWTGVCLMISYVDRCLSYD